MLRQTFTRGDYKELVELSLFYLTQGQEPQNLKLLHPGAFHKARWMAKLIFCLKINLLANDISTKLPKGAVFGKGQQEKISRFTQFVVFTYLPWWLTSSVSSSAPFNDLLLVKSLNSYKLIDELLANTALQAPSRHTWYLSEKLVPLCLFSTDVTEDAKKSVVSVLMQTSTNAPSKRFGTGYGKPYLPSVPRENATLNELVGNDSWNFFKIINLPHDFLKKPIATWPDDAQYQAYQLVVSHMQVVNGVAERGVKLCNDFIGSSRDEERF